MSAFVTLTTLAAAILASLLSVLAFLAAPAAPALVPALVDAGASLAALPVRPIVAVTDPDGDRPPAPPFGAARQGARSLARSPSRFATHS